MEATRAVPYLMMHNRLSTEGCFILCNSNAKGFPIFYASQGFVDLFGYSAVECHGVKCGDLVARRFDLDMLNAVSELPKPSIEKALGHIESYTAEQCRLMMANPLEHNGFSLVVNVRKDGTPVVIELVMLVHRHPTLNLTYVVGLQSDVSQQLPLKALLQAAQNPTHYKDLLTSHWERLAGRMERLGVKTEAAVRYLNEKAFEMCPVLLQSQFHKSLPPADCASTQAGSSLCSETDDTERTSEASHSGASILSSSTLAPVPQQRVRKRASRHDTNQLRRFWWTFKAIEGVWSGRLNEELGGCEYSIVFRHGFNIVVKVMGHTLTGSFSLDVDGEISLLDVQLPAPNEKSSASADLPVRYIMKVDGDTLHLCCSVTSCERPSLFEGAGYCVMHRQSLSKVVEDVDAVTSIGSVDHPDSCTPCSFFWHSKNGCTDAADCIFCHVGHEELTAKKSIIERRKKKRNKRLEKLGEEEEKLEEEMPSLSSECTTHKLECQTKLVEIAEQAQPVVRSLLEIVEQAQPAATSPCKSKLDHEASREHAACEPIFYLRRSASGCLCLCAEVKV